VITRNDFAHALIEELRRRSGDFYPHSTHNARALITQMQVENDGSGRFHQARFNPFNTTWHEPGDGSTILAGNTAGVREYPDFKTGVEATAKTLLQTQESYGYGPVRDALKRDARPAVTIRAIGKSAWGTNLELALEVLQEVKADYWQFAHVPIGQ